ncbi:MAG TPA: hypothetical protein VMU54_05610, partial [Planctomycetota bacterium]|nr:hypothetical protein [Planctomycetota bacterium]
MRLRSADFERGGAQRRDDFTFCSPCALKPGTRPEPPVASKPSKNTTRHIPVVLPPSTTRIPIATPRRPIEAVPRASVSPALVWGGVALGAAVILLAALMLGSGSRRPGVQDPPSSRSAAAGSPPFPAPAARGLTPETTPPPRAPSSESDDWALLERRVAESVGRERFREALDLLEAERKRHDSLEWTAAVQRASLGVEASAKKLCQDLQAKMAAARARGADAEVRALADRIAGWGLPAVFADSEPGAAVQPRALVAAPDPSPAAPEPQPDAAPAAAPAPATPREKPAPVPFTPGPLKWELLAPLRATASQGTRLAILEDGSILAEGGTPRQEQYAVVIQTTLGGIAALRLEVLTDRSLPASGPGRAHNGNFVLTELQVQVLPDTETATGTPIPIERAAAEHCQEGFPIAHVFDGRNDTGWAILPLVGRSLEAIFELHSPLPSKSPLTLLVILDHQSIHPQHEIGRFRLSASVSKGAASDIALRPPPPVDQETVDAAIRRGLAWLRTSGSPGSDIAGGKKPRIPNCDDLLLLTFLHAGMPENDPRFQQLLASVLAAPCSHTYSAAIRAMALEELDRARYQPQIARCAQFLLDNQTATGQWGYGEPSVAVDSIRADVPAATAAAVRPAASTTPRTKPKVVQKISVRPTRTPAGNGDFSNSQYAALGLR